MAVAAFAISILALLVSGVAALYTRRQTLAAERSATADERAAAIAEAEAARYVPPWTLSVQGKDRRVLRNGGEEPAFDVVLDLTDFEIVDGKLDHDRIDARSAVSFFAIFPTDESDLVRVTWSRSHGGERLSWSHPVPLSSG
jgi:hypothetical protein